MATELDADLERCAHFCHACEDACLMLIPHCLRRGGEHAGNAHIGTLLDCIAICAASHGLLHRGSPLHPETCRACAAICAACAKDCAELGEGDAQMMECAHACVRCADSCRRMVGSKA